jgi:hypothetical protein
MTNTRIAPLSIQFLLICLVVGGILGMSACSPEPVKQVTKEATKEITKEATKEMTKVATATLATPIPTIKKEAIDVGKEYGLGIDQRYHKMHVNALDIKCTTCHTAQVDTENAALFGRDVSPKSPGLVDRSACLACHRTGPGKALYSSKGTR